MPGKVPDPQDPQADEPIRGCPSGQRRLNTRGGPEQSTGARIRRMRPEDLSGTARAHTELLPQGLFPALGERFLRQWHTCVFDESHSIALVVEDATYPEHRVVGFLLGATDQSAHINGILLQHRDLGKLIGLGIIALLSRPRTAIRFARTRAAPWTRRLILSIPKQWPPVPESANNTSKQTAVLSAVALYPLLRGKGTGTALVEQFLRESQAAGAETATLVTKRAAEGAGRFYARLGWQAVQESTTRDGAPIRVYHFPLGQTPLLPKESGQ